MSARLPVGTTMRIYAPGLTLYHDRLCIITDNRGSDYRITVLREPEPSEVNVLCAPDNLITPEFHSAAEAQHWLDDLAKATSREARGLRNLGFF